MFKVFSPNYSRRVMMLMSLLMFAVLAFAVPAKPGLTRLLTLSNGSTVMATLVGDEHAHYWLGADGKAYQSAGNDVYQSVDLQAVKQHGAQRRAAANQRRTRRLAPRKVGEVGSITGDKKGIIILVNFKDVSFTASQADFNNLANTPNYNSGNYKGSMYDYFYAQSDGQFRLTFDVVGPYTLNQNCAYYGGNNSSGDDLRPGAMVKEAIQLANNDVNFANYDWDGDGTVEQVYVVYAGKGEADGGAANTIWPHEWDLVSATGSSIKLDGKTINTYACGGEQDGSTGETAGIGTMCHEFSHCLGYPDFYDTDYSGGQGMFQWDLMDSGSYNGGGYQPAGYTTYERWVAGWKEPIELVNTQSISNMKALQDTGSDTYIIYNKGNRNEYYLLENRQKTGWDASLPGKGLLILHVDYDATAWSNNTPNDVPSHQRMTWIPADNEYQYTTYQGSKYYTTAGAKNDPFPYGSVNAFGKNTTPAATLFNNNSDGTKYLDSSVENITQNSDGTISFDFVDANDQVDPTPTPTGDALLYEGLSGYSGSDSSTELTTSNSYLDYNSWSSISKVYPGGSAFSNGGCLKFGSSSAAGSMTSSSISLTGSGTLTFYLKKYGSDTGKLNVTVTGATADKTQFTPDADWTLCTVNLTNATGAVTITLATTSKRAYVDEITLIGGSSSGGDDPTDDYYKKADGKKGEALKTAMCGIIYNRTEKSYDYLWTAFQTTDVRSDGNIWDMYSNITKYTPVTSGSEYSKEGDCYNREHSWPQSWFSSNAPMYTDLHHIYPTDGFVNGKRSNYPFGETNNPTYSSENGFSKLGPCSYDGYTGVVFEPADEYKGDFARTYFYMVTCYEEKLADWYAGNADGIQATIDGSTYPAFQTWQLNMLMEWAKNDPVSEKEINRNNAVYAIQNNRNPFIDYPGLQEYIWGICTNETFDYDDYVEPVYSTPVTVPELTISNVTENGAEATWTACDGVTEYTLQLASDDQFTASTTTGGTATTLISESFEGNSIPSGWTASSSNVAIASGKSGDGTYCVAFKGADAYLITPLVTNPSNVSFNYKRSSNNAGWALEVSYATSTSGPWTYIGTTSVATTDWQTFSMELDNAGSVYIKFTDTRSSGNAERYIDLVQITGVTSGSTVPGSLIAEETVNGTSFTFTGLDPETTYFARVKGNAEWSNVEQFTTDPATSISQEPVWSSTFPTTASVNIGDLYSIENISSYVSGTPAPNILMTCPDGLQAEFANDTFTFLPEASGDYTFTFTADNGVGDPAVATLTVTVAPAPVPVPELAVSNITATTAEATWTACDGVTEYTLQLASDDQFSNGGGSATPILSEDFSGFSGQGTNDIVTSMDNNTATAGWTGSKVYCNNGEAKIGASSDQGWIITPGLSVSGSFTVVFSARRYGTGDQPTLSLGISEDGSDFIDETISLNDDMTEYSRTFDVTGSTAYIRWMGSGSSKARFYLDNVVISNTSSGEGSLIAEYTVNGTEFTFTGLDPETTYYARVKGNAGWSNVEQFETEALETITLANASDNTSVIEANNGKLVNVKLSDRTLYKDGSWNTLCLPFSLTEEQVANQLAPGSLMTLQSSSFRNGTLTLNFAKADSIEAGKPYIVKWTNDSPLESPTFTGVTIANATANVNTDNVDFIGIYSPLNITAADNTKLYLSNANTLYYPNAAMTIGAFRAYFQLKGITAADLPQSAIVLNFDAEGTTSLNSLTPALSQGEGVYTLDGRKLNAMPTQKGVYIVNGKKVVIK